MGMEKNENRVLLYNYIFDYFIIIRLCFCFTLPATVNFVFNHENS